MWWIAWFVHGMLNAVYCGVILLLRQRNYWQKAKGIELGTKRRDFSNQKIYGVKMVSKSLL